MKFQIIRSLDLEVSPWKNGGGSTREILRLPSNADLNTFDVRCSIANVESSGPFSKFENHQRTIVQLSGPPMRLVAANSTQPVELIQFEPFSFDGSDAIQSFVTSPSIDYNFMIRKSFGSLRQEVLNSSKLRGMPYRMKIPARSSAYLFVMRGYLEISSVHVDSSGLLGEFDIIILESPTEDNLNVDLKLIGTADAITHIVTPN